VDELAAVVGVAGEVVDQRDGVGHPAMVSTGPDALFLPGAIAVGSLIDRGIPSGFPGPLRAAGPPQPSLPARTRANRE
jgi:hypothetical protein